MGRRAAAAGLTAPAVVVGARREGRGEGFVRLPRESPPETQVALKRHRWHKKILETMQVLQRHCMNTGHFWTPKTNLRSRNGLLI